MGLYTPDLMVFHEQTLGAALTQGERRRGFHPSLHALTVERLIGLGAGRPDRRAFARIEHPELYTRLVNSPGHFAAQRVNLPNQMALADAANGGIARHMADVVEVERQHQRFCA